MITERHHAAWIQTASGKKFHPWDPNPSDLDITDIASALSKICRFTGHTKHHYSVAQHSLVVSAIVSPKARMWGLMHDATEAYYGDLSSPLKRLWPAYEEGEHNLAGVICSHFKILFTPEIADEVHDADLWLCTKEAQFLLEHPETLQQWDLMQTVKTFTPHNDLVNYAAAIQTRLPPERIEREFVQAFQVLARAD